MKTSVSSLVTAGKRLASGLAFLSIITPGMLSAAVSGGFGMAPLTNENGIVAYSSGGTSFIDFCPENTGTPLAPGCSVVNDGKGKFTVSGGTGTFATVPNGTPATIDDISNLPAIPYTTFPVGVPVSIHNFLTISSKPNLDFEATLFENLTCSGVGVQCLNGFQFSQVGNNVSVAIVIDGIVHDSTDGSTGKWQAVITAQYTNTTILAVANGAASPTGVAANSWSGSVFVTPNPSTFSGCTVTQGGWGAPAHGNNPGTFLNANFPATPVVIGSGYPTINPAPGPYWLAFTTSTAVRNFLPQGGPPNALNGSAVNPTTSSAGVFAGQVLALQLNVQLKGFGTKTLTGTGTSLDGLTVAQILGVANTAISGGALPSGFTYSSLNNLIDLLNNAYDGCTPTAWATAHLI